MQSPSSSIEHRQDYQCTGMSTIEVKRCRPGGFLIDEVDITLRDCRWCGWGH